MDLRKEHVVVETDRYRIEADLTLPREGYRSRLSDYVNRRDREFFALSDAVLVPFDASEDPERLAFVMVARRHIRLIRLAAES